MGLFRKDPVNDLLKSRNKRREYLTHNADVWGDCLMMATPSASSLLIDNYVDQTASYYFMPDGSIHIWSKESFDEFKSDKVSVWAFGYGDNFPEYLCFRMELMAFTFVIQETLQGNALTWLSERFPGGERDTLNVF